MLEAAGVPFASQVSSIDEAALKSAACDARTTALELAKAKAVDVSKRSGGSWVIGSDSVVAVDGRLYDKPRGRDDAADHLARFSGRTIELTSGVALARSGNVDWVHGDTALLHVRELSSAFIDGYLDEEWPDVSYCVGVFRMEGRGVHLFDRVEGDHFTILGMPLIPLLRALRERKIIAS